MNSPTVQLPKDQHRQVISQQSKIMTHTKTDLFTCASKSIDCSDSIGMNGIHHQILVLRAGGSRSSNVWVTKWSHWKQDLYFSHCPLANELWVWHQTQKSKAKFSVDKWGNAHPYMFTCMIQWSCRCAVMHCDMRRRGKSPAQLFWVMKCVCVNNRWGWYCVNLWTE